MVENRLGHLESNTYALEAGSEGSPQVMKAPRWDGLATIVGYQFVDRSLSLGVRGESGPG